MAEVLDYAERRTRACIAALPDGDAHARATCWRRADGDLELRLAATVDGERLVLDFTGSAAQHDGNLNCPLAVTRSACYFAVRVLTDPDIPPSAGAYRPIEVRAPEGSLLNARSPAAVVAGNVETSSRVADLVLAAFGRALGQGTMNNLTLGDDDVHLLRDARRRPGRVPGRRRPERRARRDEQHAQHAGRGARAGVPAARRRSTRCGAARAAAGRYRGGDGVVRELEALAPMTLLAADRAPPSCAARRGRRRARARAGATCSTARELPPKARGELAPGQRLRIETPGGGGQG